MDRSYGREERTLMDLMEGKGNGGESVTRGDFIVHSCPGGHTFGSIRRFRRVGHTRGLYRSLLSGGRHVGEYSRVQTCHWVFRGEPDREVIGCESGVENNLTGVTQPEVYQDFVGPTGSGIREGRRTYEKDIVGSLTFSGESSRTPLTHVSTRPIGPVLPTCTNP